MMSAFGFAAFLSFRFSSRSFRESATGFFSPFFCHGFLSPPFHFLSAGL